MNEMIETFKEAFAFNRTRTLLTLEQITAMDNPVQVLGWRPGEGRAHIAWQLVHIGITEELFGVDRLAKRHEDAKHKNIWERFQGGSTPDDDIPTVDEIRQVLNDGRAIMLDTLSQFNEQQLDSFTWIHPRLGKELDLRTTLNIINWHEGHHQGQAHIILNLYNNQ